MEAECSDDVMKLRVKFNDTFSGLIYSAGKLNFNISFNSLGLLAFFEKELAPKKSVDPIKLKFNDTFSGLIYSAGELNL